MSLSPTAVNLPLRIRCILEGDTHLFTVNVNSDDDIYDLRKAVFIEAKASLVGIEAKDLDLRNVRSFIRLSTTLGDHLRQVGIDLRRNQELSALKADQFEAFPTWGKLRDLFILPLPESALHVLAVKPSEYDRFKCFRTMLKSICRTFPSAHTFR